MIYSRHSYSTDRLYRPSVIELAQAGNCRALTYWMNSLLTSQGIQVWVKPASSHHCLKIFVDFQPSTPREACLDLRDPLVRFICYRLWTLNSKEILAVKIIARIAGGKPVWQQSVRINTPASSERLRQIQILRTQRQESSFSFQFLRSLLLSSVTLAGFYIGYRLFYLELSKILSPSPSIHPSARLDQASSEPELSILRAQAPAQLGKLDTTLDTLGTTLDKTVTEPFQGRVITQIRPAQGKKVIALTFDDGPWPETTEQVLAVLHQFNVKATFFMVGLHVQHYPELAKRVVEAGHAIGNHTWNHPLQHISETDTAQEIEDMEQLLYETTGARTTLFRPPTPDQSWIEQARQQKYVTVLWSVDSEDYYVSAPILLDNVLQNVQPGRIIRLHDGRGNRSATIQALPQIISALKQQGYQFVTLPELMMQADSSEIIQPDATQPEAGASPDPSWAEPSRVSPTAPLEMPSPRLTVPAVAAAFVSNG